MEITDIRYEGYYVSEDDDMEAREHTEETYELFLDSIEMVDEVKYYMSDGVCFINGNPYAELIDFEGGLHYKRINQ